MDKGWLFRSLFCCDNLQSGQNFSRIPEWTKSFKQYYVLVAGETKQSVCKKIRFKQAGSAHFTVWLGRANTHWFVFNTQPFFTDIWELRYFKNISCYLCLTTYIRAASTDFSMGGCVCVCVCVSAGNQKVHNSKCGLFDKRVVGERPDFQVFPKS